MARLVKKRKTARPAPVSGGEARGVREVSGTGRAHRQSADRRQCGIVAPLTAEALWLLAVREGSRPPIKVLSSKRCLMRALGTLKNRGLPNMSPASPTPVEGENDRPEHAKPTKIWAGAIIWLAALAIGIGGLYLLGVAVDRVW
jgi:hypothetical protein